MPSRKKATGPVDRVARDDYFLKLRESGLSASEAARVVGLSRRQALARQRQLKQALQDSHREQ